MFKIAICDDNLNDIGLIKEIVEKYLDKKVILYSITEFRAGEELISTLEDFDVVFLDIVMGKGINGISAGERFHNLKTNTKIIYITSFPQYCAQAINKVHAFGYLTKPIKKEQVIKQLEDVLELIDKEKSEKPSIIFKVMEMGRENKTDTVIKEFIIEDIIYFEFVNRKIKIKTKEGEFYFRGQMKDLVKKMNDYTFGCCHQSYLINLRYASKIVKYNLYLKNGELLPVSQKKSSEFREKLNAFIQKSI